MLLILKFSAEVKNSNGGVRMQIFSKFICVCPAITKSLIRLVRIFMLMDFE